MSPAGAGKTTLLEKTITQLKDKYRIGVIEGDIQTTADADRIKELGVPAFQITTGSLCHLDGKMIHSALSNFALHLLDVLIIENVGNLVCPAEFNLGEADKVMMLSVTGGDDKPKKYPLMFHESKVLLINKMDLHELSGTDTSKIEKDSKEINSTIKIFKISCKTNEGLEDWYNWLESRIKETIKCA